MRLAERESFPNGIESLTWRPKHEEPIGRKFRRGQDLCGALDGAFCEPFWSDFNVTSDALSGVHMTLVKPARFMRSTNS